MNTIEIEYLEKGFMSGVYYSKTAYITNEFDGQLNNGIECVYMPVNANSALKLYPYSSDAQSALKSQSEASYAKVGPEVLSRVMEIIFPMGADRDAEVLKCFFPSGKCWGYYTVKADTKRCLTHGCKLDKAIKDLRSRIQEAKLSFPIMDLHHGNIAYVGDTLVAIDFGYHTTGKITVSEIRRRENG